uniref:Auxin response factor n=1 Tax=Nelumbo nucifera TaxID=4432 RepID=A0A822XXF0_NELNU|nr:TPA_asm: hypothetical protein HUJ06_025857 [Nelumbo nucifera]
MALQKVIELRNIDPHIWKACAGSSVEIPVVGTKVYYFPQGHAEQASSAPNFSSLVCAKDMVLCRIVSVMFLANPDTDEVFVRIRLEPLDRSLAGFIRKPPVAVGFSQDGGIDDTEEKVVSFAKILTPSDANNGGGFSVPRFCADSIFPALDYKAEPPVQTISVKDVHGVVWEFRHIYRGTPRRHLLTTGWSKFVNHKKLVAGDSVVFMKNQSGELSVGIRRTARSNGSVDCIRWNYHVGAAANSSTKLEEEFGCGEAFSRSSRGRVPAESVVEAAELAGANRPFEVIYYPRTGSPDFVVKAEDSSRMTWFQGTVSSIATPDHGPWKGSFWRMLQVNWDEPEVLQNVNRVSPWQVELAAATPPLQTPFPPTKKFKVPQNPDLLTGEGPLFFPMTGLSNSMMGHLNLTPSLFNYNTFPAGMQGARHDPICVSSLSNFVSKNMGDMYSNNIYGNKTTPKSSCVSTELSIGSSSHSDNSSPHSQGSVHFFGTETSGHHNCNMTAKASVTSFQLFGKTIQTKQTAKSGFDDGGCMEDEVIKEYKEADGVSKPLHSSSYPYEGMYNGLDVQCQRVSAVEACSL